jgi:HK97 family phage prohead protease
MDNLLFKTTGENLEFKEVDDGFVHIKGYASTFGNVDRVGDVIEEGAFSMSLTERMPKLLNQHNMTEPLGVIDRAYETEKGLIIEARMPKENSMVRDLLPLLKMGAIGDFSIGFSVKDAEMREDGIRILKEIDLWEVSIVTMPANAKAKIMHVKKLEQQIEDYQKKEVDMDEKIVDAIKAETISTKREFEQMLKETGVFTKKATVILASKFKEDLAQGDPDTKKDKQSDSVDVKSILEAINETKKTFTKD